MNYMATRIEVWPVAATRDGIWLLSGVGPWASADPVPADSTPWWDMEALLRERRIAPRLGDVFEDPLVTAVLNHQTSNRWDATGQIDTFITVLPDDTPTIWPGARPVSLPAVQGMGRPAPHPSTDLPKVISAAGVFLHALRHLRHLCLYDADAERDMPSLMASHLTVLHPVLAGLYSASRHKAA